MGHHPIYNCNQTTACGKIPILYCLSKRSELPLKFKNPFEHSACEVFGIRPSSNNLVKGVYVLYPVLASWFS
jgi:hypothetical protein